MNFRQYNANNQNNKESCLLEEAGLFVVVVSVQVITLPTLLWSVFNMPVDDLVIGKVYFAAVLAGRCGIGPQVIKAVVDYNSRY
jgi:hypothetical protein